MQLTDDALSCEVFLIMIIHVFSCGLRMIRILLAAALSIIAVLQAPVRAADLTRDVRVIGVQAGIFAKQQAFFEKTVRELNAVTEDRVFVVRPIAEGERFDMKAYRKLDFAIVSPHVFALLERYGGFKSMASLYVPVGGESRSIVSAMVYAKPVSGHAHGLGELAKKPVAVIAGDVSDVSLLLQNEMLQRKLAPPVIHEFGRGMSPEHAVSIAIKSGFEAVAVSTDFVCERENDLFDGWVPVDLRLDDASGLASSTEPVPGWVFAAGLSIAGDNVRDLAATLLSLDISNDMHWGPAADYRPVHRIAERVRDPAYMSYQKKTLQEILEDNISWVLLALAVVFGMLWHSIAAERLVRQRSSELMATVKKQRAAERQFEELERLTAVSQMSNIVAHELRQPLAAVSNFAMGLRRRMSNGTLNEGALDFALGRILSENERASDIVEHVRGYARRRQRQIESIDLSFMIRKIASSLKASMTQTDFVCNVPEVLVMEGDSLEIELIFRNLMKNAAESAASDPQPRVSVSAQEDGTAIRFVVEDNGPVATEDTVAALAVPLVSGKTGGLGIGLSIVRKLTESYGGRVAFEPADPKGLRAVLTLPVKPELVTSDLEKTNGQ